MKGPDQVFGSKKPEFGREIADLERGAIITMGVRVTVPQVPENSALREALLDATHVIGYSLAVLVSLDERRSLSAEWARHAAWIETLDHPAWMDHQVAQSIDVQPLMAALDDSRQVMTMPGMRQFRGARAEAAGIAAVLPGLIAAFNSTNTPTGLTGATGAWPASVGRRLRTSTSGGLASVIRPAADRPSAHARRSRASSATVGPSPDSVPVGSRAVAASPSCLRSARGTSFSRPASVLGRSPRGKSRVGRRRPIPSDSCHSSRSLASINVTGVATPVTTANRHGPRARLH